MSGDRVFAMVERLAGAEMQPGIELLEAAQAFLNGLADDVVWDASECPDGGVYHGRLGVCEFFCTYLSAWRSYSFAVRSVDALDDPFVVVDVEERGESRSGITVHRRHWQVWTFDDDGLVARWVTFRDPVDAARWVVTQEEEIAA